MARNFINRRNAVAFLLKVLANSKFDEEDEQKMTDIIHCIEAEMENYHEWGADTSEAVILHFPTDSRQIRTMDRDELRRIYKKYRFIPSEQDKNEAKERIKYMLDLINGLGYDDLG